MAWLLTQMGIWDKLDRGPVLQPTGHALIMPR